MTIARPVTDDVDDGDDGDEMTEMEMEMEMEEMESMIQIQIGVHCAAPTHGDMGTHRTHGSHDVVFSGLIGHGLTEGASCSLPPPARNVRSVWPVFDMPRVPDGPGGPMGCLGCLGPVDLPTSILPWELGAWNWRCWTGAVKVSTRNPAIQTEDGRWKMEEGGGGNGELGTVFLRTRWAGLTAPTPKGRD